MDSRKGDFQRKPMPRQTNPLVICNGDRGGNLVSRNEADVSFLFTLLGWLDRLWFTS